MDLLTGLRNITQKFLGNSISAGASFMGWAMPGTWSKNEAIKKYAGYVYTIVSSIAQESAKAEFLVDRLSTSGIVPVTNHPFIQLLKKPNSDDSQFQFLEMHFTFMKLAGESFWYLARGGRTGLVKEMYLLRPDLMEAVIDKDDPLGRIGSYMFTPTRQSFAKNEILHFKTPNPMDKNRGLGPVQAGRTYVETEGYTSLWTRNSIYNSGRPSGILNIKSNITPDQFEKLKRQFKQEYSGTQNAGKTLLLQGKDGIDYAKLGMELGEVALKDLKDMSRDDIMIMFRVSKTILGITDDVNRANAIEARAVFTENVIKPELDRFIDHLNVTIIPEYGVDFKLRYVDPTPKSAKEALEAAKEGYNKWLTGNDIRISLGMKPLPGLDVIYRPINEVPITQRETKSLRKKKMVMPDRVAIFKQIFFDNQGVWERKWDSEMVKEFDTQKKEILARNPAKSRSKQAFVEWLFDANAAKGRMVAAFIPMGIELMKEAARFAFDLADDPDRELEMNERMRRYIQDRIDRFTTDTNDETAMLIGKTIAEGVANGESVAKLRKRIEEVYEQANRVRATMIARTETLAASNEAANEAYRQSPMVTRKEWSVEADACPFCQTFAGKVIGLNEEFVKVGDTIKDKEGNELHVDYENVQHPPLHPNCKCAIIPSRDS